MFIFNNVLMDKNEKHMEPMMDKNEKTKRWTAEDWSILIHVVLCVGCPVAAFILMSSK